MSNSHFFHRKDLERILEECLNKTLGEVDSNNVFERTKIHPKITGIAGDVIEQSVLGYPPDTRQEPDLDIDGVKTELKTTGIQYIRNNSELVAKEPMSITAVSPHTIINETFDDSKFWHKLAHLLFIYYLYDSKEKVKAAGYANFPIKGYQFYEFNSEDREILKNDWEIVRDFIRCLQNEYVDYEDEYPRISNELRPKLMYIDTSPKWPNRPRFRLKKSVVTTIVQDHFGESLEQLPKKYHSYSEIYDTCHELTKKYKGKSIQELIDLLHIKKMSKSIGEQIIVKMFGGTSKKMNDIELFNKVGIIGKTITLTENNTRKEDMKFFTIDFDEITNKDYEFEDSQFYNHFSNNRFLCIIFKRPYKGAKARENKFLGFKMIDFDEKFIEEDVKKTWTIIRNLILNNELKDIIRLDKNGNPKINKNGIISSAPNFPKSKDGNVFVRGSGLTSDTKPLEINGINMYYQQIWVKGKYIVEKLNEIDYI